MTQGIEQISVVIQINSATAAQSATDSKELNSQAQVLKDLADNFRLR